MKFPPLTRRRLLLGAASAAAVGCASPRAAAVPRLRLLGETILPPELLSFIGDADDHHEHPPTALNRILNGDASPPIGIDAVPRLSPREKCILRCVVEGDSNKAIARKISIAEATVKVHVKAILRKVRLNNRTQAAIWAINNSSLIWSADADSPPPEMMIVSVPLAPAEHNGRAIAGVCAAKR